jgi:hypothetical protein
MCSKKARKWELQVEYFVFLFERTNLKIRTGMFFPISLSLFSVSVFIKEEFNVTGIFLGLNIPVIWP